MSPFTPEPSQHKKKDWNEAVRHYNLPRNGIEVVIPSDHKPRKIYGAQPATQKRVEKPAIQPKAKKHGTSSSSKMTTNTVASQVTTKVAPATSAPIKPAHRRHPIRYMITRTFTVIGVLAVLGNIPVYSMIRAPDNHQLPNLANPATTTSAAYESKDLILPAVAAETYAGYALDILPDAQQGNWTMRTVVENDDLDSLLSTIDLTRTAEDMLKDSAIEDELRELKPGSRVLMQVVEGRLLQLIYAKSPTETYIVSATDHGFTGKWDDEQLFKTHEAKTSFVIKHSLLKDGRAAGLSKSLINQLTQVFSKDTDFKRIRVNDTLGVIYEDFVYQGESIYTDKILAAEYNTKNASYQRIRFTLDDGKTDYFHPDGDDAELKRIAFDRKPIEGGYQSSGFGMRVHPIFGVLRAHTGVDFAAPYGTPIFATADGDVKFFGQQNGYGNVVELRHDDGVSTVYGHMSAFADDLSNGKTIKRGEVIGYVGSTGNSTGNHVHYEYRINGEPQDPTTVELPVVGIMSKDEAKHFASYAANMTDQLDELRKLAKLEKPSSKAIGG